MNRGVAGTDASWSGQLGGSLAARPGAAGGIWLAPVAGEQPLGPGAGGRPSAGGVAAADTGFQAGAGARPGAGVWRGAGVWPGGGVGPGAGGPEPGRPTSSAGPDAGGTGHWP